MTQIIDLNGDYIEQSLFFGYKNKCLKWDFKTRRGDKFIDLSTEELERLIKAFQNLKECGDI